jgi:hypothetical protein
MSCELKRFNSKFSTHNSKLDFNPYLIIYRVNSKLKIHTSELLKLADNI